MEYRTAYSITGGALGSRCEPFCRLGAALVLAVVSVSAFAQPADLSLSRPARPWEFLSSVGTRAAMFGNEAGSSKPGCTRSKSSAISISYFTLTVARSQLIR
jgi:hypothetical protein